MATKGYVSALGGLAKDAVIGAGKGFVGGLKGAMMSEAPGITGAYAFAKELRSRANAPKMSSGGSAPSPPAANKPSSSSPMAGGLGVTNDKSIVAVLRQGNIINLEQVSQLKQLNANVINQSKLLKFTVDDTKRKDQFAEEVAKEQALRDDRLLEAIKKIGGGFGGKGKAGAADEGKSGGLGGLIGDYGKELALGGLAVLFRKQIASVLARIVASPLTGMAVNAAIAGGTFLATIGSGLAAALRIILTTALRALVTNPIGLAALGLGALFKTSRDTEEKQKQEAIKNNLPVAPMPTKTYEKESKELTTQAAAETNGLKRAELLEKAKLASQKIDAERVPSRGEALPNRQKAWTEKYGETHNLDGTPKAKNPVSTVSTASAYNLPVGNGEVTSRPGPRLSKTTGMSTVHQGVDISAVKGSNVNSIAAGKVIEVDKEGSVRDAKGHKKGLGRFVTIDHGNGLTSKYGHLSVVSVNIGDEVGPGAPAGFLLGKSGGNTEDPGSGVSTGAHLHLETTKDKIPIDPASLPGLVGLGKVGNSMQGRATQTALPPAATPGPAAANSPASTAVPAAGAVNPNNTQRRRVGTAAEPFGDYYARLFPNRKKRPGPKPLEADLDYFKNERKELKQEAELNKLNAQKITLQQNLKEVEGGKFADPESKAKLIQKYKDDIAEIDKKILLIREGTKPATTPVVPKAVVSSAPNSDALSGQYSAEQLAALPKFGSSQFSVNALTVASADGKFLPDGGIPGYTSGTKMKPEVIQVEDKKLAKQIAKANVGTGKAAAAVAKQTFVAASGKQLPTKLDPFKPNFRGNTEILAEANKQFLKELRSTFTGLARKGLKDALLPDGVGVSFKQATQDNLFRGQQLKIINDTTKKINAAAVDLLGKKYGPMFAPMLDKLSTSYFEVGSRLAGRQLFTRFGGLDDKETMGITGQVLGNIAAGKKQLAFEQVLFGMSGGRKSGIALNAESLFAKYGFEDSQQGISYFADVLGEKATQPFSKLMGADDRSKSIIRDPRTGKLVYADSGKEATKDDIKAGYGGRISKEPLLGPENEYLEVPGYKGSVAGTGGPDDQYAIKDAKGKIIGRMAEGMTKSSVTGGSISAPASKAIVGGGTIKQILNADSKDISRNTVFGTTEAERIAGGDALRAKENTYVAAQVELLNRSIEQERELAKAGAKREYDAALKVAKSEEEANEETYKYEKTLTEIQNANADVNAKAVINKLDEGQKGSAGDGTAPAGLKVSGRRPGQLFDANVYDKDGKIEGKDPMKEIGNFGFDILKLGVGSEMTKGISNPYIQTIANFAIQKGMNAGIEAIMGTGGDGGIFSKIGSMFSSSSSSSSYGGYGGGGGGGIFDWVTSLFKDGGLVSFPKGGPVRGKGTGTSDSIPAYVSNGEFVVNAKAAARNYALLNAINQSTLPKKNTSGSGTYEDSGGPMDPTPGLFDGMTKAQQAAYFDVNPFAAKVNALVDTLLGFTTFGSIVNFFDPLGKPERAAIRGGYQSYSDFRDSMGAFANAKTDAAKFSGLTGSLARQAELDAEKADQSAQQNSTGKSSWGKSGNADQDIGPKTTDNFTPIDAVSTASDTDVEGGDLGAFLAKGGLVTGKGSGTSDSIFSMLSNGEFVINAKATKANLALLNQINSSTSSGSVPKSEYERNLSIEPFKNTFKGFADGGLVAAANKSSTMNAVPRPTSRSPYILSPPTNNSSSENQNNSSNMIIGPKTSTRIDNSSVTNFYNQASGMIDSIRSVTPQVA